MIAGVGAAALLFTSGVGRAEQPMKATLQSHITKKKPADLPIVEYGACPAICDKLLQCKSGPWTKKEECIDACQIAAEDETSGRTYECVAKAITCTKVKSCAK